ncbi:MAG TPA: response regulator [Allocoleopsis sp.]
MTKIQKILLINDSATLMTNFRQLFPGNKVEIMEAKNANEGLNLIREQHPNLVISDFISPEVSGWDVFQELSNNQDLWDISLIMMSGKKDEVVEKITEPFEYFELLESPFEQSEIMAAIKNAMQKAEKRKAKRAKTSPKVQKNSDNTAMQKEIDQLKSQVSSMGTEIEKLKTQVSQLVNFVKQKVK